MAIPSQGGPNALEGRADGGDHVCTCLVPGSASPGLPGRPPGEPAAQPGPGSKTKQQTRTGRKGVGPLGQETQSSRDRNKSKQIHHQRNLTLLCTCVHVRWHMCPDTGDVLAKGSHLECSDSFHAAVMIPIVRARPAVSRLGQHPHTEARKPIPGLQNWPCSTLVLTGYPTLPILRRQHQLRAHMTQLLFSCGKHSFRS
jgi:hypothetical protein